MTNYSRSVLKSNGPHRSKNLPVKFGFTLKTVSATIAKKLPLQLRPKPLFIAFFSLSHKRPTFAFTGESGYTLGFRRRIAHSGLHAETGGVSDGGGITTLGAFRTFTNIPGPGIRTASFAAFGAWSGVLPKNAESLRNSDALMRVAVPKASRPRWAALLCCWFLRYTGKLRGSLSLHPRAERKICCWGCLVFACGVGDSSLVTAVPFLNRCSHRSMRETYPLGQRSGCRF